MLSKEMETHAAPSTRVLVKVEQRVLATVTSKDQVDSAKKKFLGAAGIDWQQFKRYFYTVYSKHRCSIITKEHKNLFKNTRASWSTRYNSIG